jgi:hypothetical protein
MIENLHTKLTSVLQGAGVSVALSEDEVTHYPYVTFELPTEYRYDKDGAYKVVGNLTIRSVSDDFDEADALRASIHAAIAGGFGGLTPVPPADEEETQASSGTRSASEDPYTYTARLTDVRKDCMDGIWVIEQDYILQQYQ